MAELQTQSTPLDEVMLAMDVVDTLRHRQHLVERELNEEERDKQLVNELRKIYSSQGIDVPDQVLREGLAALKEERFAYRPPPPGLGMTLARWYVTRDKWLKPVAAVLILAAAAAMSYLLLVRGPARRYQAALPEKLATQRQVIVELSHSPEASQQAERLAAEGQHAIQEGDVDAVQQVLARLQTLRDDLEREYELRIVSRPNERTGVIRTPDLNEDAKNYYIIVEAVDADGKILKLPVANEEDGKMASLSAWGLRVEKDVYDKVSADKQDDGIIQNRVFGVKRRGYLTPEYRMTTSGAALTTW